MIEDNVLKSLRTNSRKSFTEIAKENNLPITTVFNRIKALEDKKIIKNYTTEIDFAKLGYPLWNKIALKVKKENREGAKNFLIQKPEVTRLLEINSGFDFLIEIVNKNHGELKNFLELLEDKFGAEEKVVFNVIRSIKDLGGYKNV